MNLNEKNLPLITALLGFVALVLRAGLYLLGTDEKGLLIPWHPLDLLCWAVTAAALAGCITDSLRLKRSSRRGSSAPSVPAAAGAFLLAAAIAVTTLTAWGDPTRLNLIRNILGLLSIPALIWVGSSRIRGYRPPFGCHALVCLYLTLYTVSHYQTWCSQPQMQSYLFSMAGAICLALFGYYQTASAVSMGSGRLQRLVGLMAGFFCITALVGTEDPMLYLGGAAWTLTNLYWPGATPVRNDAHEAA